MMGGMPMFESLPAKHLSILDEIAPDIWRKCDVARKRSTDWPRDVVLPRWAAPDVLPLRLRPEDPDHWMIRGLNATGYEGAYTDLLMRGYRPDDRVLFMDDKKLAMFFAWRATKLDFRFDDEFAGELVRTPLTGEVPAELLRRLPASCIFVSLPHNILPGYVGFYANIDQPSKRAEPVLSIYMASPNRWPSHLIDLPLAPGCRVAEVALSKEMASQKNVEEFLKESGDPESEEKAALFAKNRAEWAESRAQATGKVLSCLLYLCSDEPDLPVDYQPSVRQEKVIGTQRRIVPPTDVVRWPVGVRIGATFKKEKASIEHPTEAGRVANTVRPHVRRAHWHTYWTGPQGNRKPSLRWLSPILVGVKSAGDGLPTVIRPVAGEKIQ